MKTQHQIKEFVNLKIDNHEMKYHSEITFNDVICRITCILLFLIILFFIIRIGSYNYKDSMNGYCEKTYGPNAKYNVQSFKPYELRSCDVLISNESYYGIDTHYFQYSNATEISDKYEWDCPKFWDFTQWECKLK